MFTYLVIKDGVPNKETCNECRRHNVNRHVGHRKKVMIVMNAKVLHMVGLDFFFFTKFSNEAQMKDGVSFHVRK